ncbi:MAG: hypothetical protein RsTaC01_0542 [Candidatus Paraimprobicoccus trichonymphae]|uniref:Transglutaminase-like domain-containing protein n=1 Tax=Candidatus Paraimprobicoccus trichonymphae TaxID=3033793 RepID=A0AA48I2R9_9FIRM|nr:MAG: hypothetical protein RsTaC01_0542 [Candidatus Paraimprobicoccus trichonymphae]
MKKRLKFLMPIFSCFVFYVANLKAFDFKDVLSEFVDCSKNIDVKSHIGEYYTFEKEFILNENYEMYLSELKKCFYSSLGNCRVCATYFCNALDKAGIDAKLLILEKEKTIGHVTVVYTYDGQELVADFNFAKILKNEGKEKFVPQAFAINYKKYIDEFYSKHTAKLIKMNKEQMLKLMLSN